MKIKDIFKKKKNMERLCYCHKCDAVWKSKQSKCPKCGRVVDGMCFSTNGLFYIDDVLSLKKMLNENP